MRIVATEEPGALVFEVLDTGRFVPRVTRRGDMPESGRGLEFMRLMMDQVDVRPGETGTRLRLVKRLHYRGSAPAAAKSPLPRRRPVTTPNREGFARRSSASAAKPVAVGALTSPRARPSCPARRGRPTVQSSS